MPNDPDNTTRKRKSHARQQFLKLAEPKPTPDDGDTDRDTWIENVCKSFVSPSKANKGYYKAVLECLWPPGHGIPGPHLHWNDLREVIDAHRRANSSDDKPYQPYRDPFRRIRELQGEEGVIGIAREGQYLQLVTLDLAEKRIPRTGLSDKDWADIIRQYHSRCAVCGRQEPEVEFEPDHKRPRMRGGGDELENWQPLCGECNNIKSTMCRGCNVECATCSWAYPEMYAPFRISSENIIRIRQRAQELGVDPNELVNNILNKAEF